MNTTTQALIAEIDQVLTPPPPFHHSTIGDPGVTWGPHPISVPANLPWGPTVTEALILRSLRHILEQLTGEAA
jgi:hypothetical protein